LAAERTAFLRLLAGDESAALIHLFKVEAAARRPISSATGQTGPRSVGIVGGGQMGAGIAATAASRGVRAHVRDVNAERLVAAESRAAKALGGREALAAAWSSTTEWEGFAEVDLVVEAVFELPELKQQTLGDISKAVPEHAVIATNTSAIQITSLASSVSSPERFLGTHFFSPVERMPLVELVPHDRTSTETLGRAAALSTRMGKVPVIVGDLPGFFTSRVYARWLIEGLQLLLDGAEPEQIDREACEVGFPVGPLQAHDEATLDLVMKASVTQVAAKVMASRIDIAAVRTLLTDLIAAGVEGRHQGAGFYTYTDGRRSGFNPTATSVLAERPRPVVAAGEAGERLLLAFVSESLLCWDDGILCHPDDGDIASVLGIGFPRTLGGPFHWTDRQGAASIAARLARQGWTFPVAETLRQSAATGRSYAELERRESPQVQVQG
jgi:3-hydroxyacyl-CoA dehydrogenase/enoyl-CoA hydratase/3-hydroxybutyryl-CoA epimerase